MHERRKIALVAKKLSLEEAEEADNLYWSQKSAIYRLKTLMDLRVMVFSEIKDASIKKVVAKRRFHEQTQF